VNLMTFADRDWTTLEQEAMKTMRKFALSALSLALALPTLAADSTPYAKGGITREFASKVREADRSGKVFRITGHCQSACTMFLAVRRVCISQAPGCYSTQARPPEVRGTC
jgi:hypothetical protein